MNKRMQCALAATAFLCATVHAANVVKFDGRLLTFIRRFEPPFDATKVRRIRLVSTSGDPALMPLFVDAFVNASRSAIPVERVEGTTDKTKPGDIDLSITALRCDVEQVGVRPGVQPFKPSTPPGQTRPWVPPGQTRNYPKNPTEAPSPILAMGCYAHLTFTDARTHKTIGSYEARNEDRGGRFGFGLAREDSKTTLKRALVPALGQLAAARLDGNDEEQTVTLLDGPQYGDAANLIRKGDLNGALVIFREWSAEQKSASAGHQNAAMLYEALGDPVSAEREYRAGNPFFAKLFAPCGGSDWKCPTAEDFFRTRWPQPGS